MSQIDASTLPDGHFDDMIPGMFDVMKWFIKQYQAYIMLGFGIVLAATLMMVILKLFVFNEKDRDDDDEGFDYHEY